MRNIINIRDRERRMPYFIEVQEDSGVYVTNQFRLVSIESTTQVTGNDMTRIISLSNEDDPILVRNENTWTYRLMPTETEYYGFPESINGMRLRLIVPDYSPSTYTDKLHYTLDISTRIGLKKIVLACMQFTEMDLLTLEHPFSSAGYDYHQYIDVDILNPWSLCYEDEYLTFRQMACGERVDTNNCGALLDVELNVVTTDDDVTYIPSIQYSSGRNLMLINERDSDYMTLRLEDHITDGRISYDTVLEFNEAYDGDFKKYLSETYFIDAEYLIPELVLMDADHIYRIDDLPLDYSMNIQHGFNDDELRFDSMDEWISGMYLTATYRIFDASGNELMDIRSNDLPMTIDRFARLVGPKIIFDDEMNITNLDIVNKIEKNIISVERPDDYKSNIIRPVFYRAYDAKDIILYNGVTFNVGIDLDQYKTKVTSFTLQVEGCSFSETGRVPGYIIFTVSGNQLPKENPTGTYYILGDNQELVTTGKYSYAE